MFTKLYCDTYVCESNHYAIYLELSTVLYVNYISVKLEEKRKKQARPETYCNNQAEY